MKKLSAIKKILSLTSIFAVTANTALAQYTIPEAYRPKLAPDIPSTQYNERGINVFLQFLAANLIYFAGAVAVIMIVWAGIGYITALGSDRMEKAKSTLIWTILGMVAMLLSFAIVQFVIRFFLALPE